MDGWINGTIIIQTQNTAEHFYSPCVTEALEGISMQLVLREFFILTFRLVLQSQRLHTQLMEYVALQHIVHFVKYGISCAAAEL